MSSRNLLDRNRTRSIACSDDAATPSETDEQCDLITDESLWPGVRALCAELGLPTGGITKFPEGSLPVYDIDGEVVLKLYPAADLSDLLTEEPVLRALQGRLPIPTPQVLRAGCPRSDDEAGHATIAGAPERFGTRRCGRLAAAIDDQEGRQ
ncbi:MAG TPA: hypothetical protein VHG10_03045 [Glycomyces sp.]|nr:hypothetical protein [Glycomyces sp.]